MKRYIEIGIGNRWFIRTETEYDDGTESEQKGIVHLSKVQGIYLRVWLGRTVFIVSSDKGLTKMKKKRATFKLVVGISGE